MNGAADLAAALAAVTAVTLRTHTASGAELLADTELIEQIGRVVDGWRIRAAAQVEHRSRKRLGEDSLAFTHGARDGIDLLGATARIGFSEARRRIGLGAALAPRIGLDGEALPGRLPELADAVAAGTVGVDAARLIVNFWKHVHHRADPKALTLTMDVILRTAEAADEAALLEVLHRSVRALDPDGDEPDEQVRRRQRALRVGRTFLDGTTQLSGRVLPEDLAVLKELLQSRYRAVPMVRTEAGSDDTDDTLGPEWRPEQTCGDPEFHDPKSRAQQDYDTVMEALRLAVRAEAEGIDGTATVHTAVITVTAEEVEQRHGQGWAPGIMAGLPMPVIERIACTDAVRLQVVGPAGETLHLTREHRTFSAAQKLALVVVAGGRCQYPGCRVPHPYLEAHHVEWFSRDEGETVIENGIMLCAYHHHLVHAKDSPIEIRTFQGEHHLVPRFWRGRPEPGHRRQTGPVLDPDRLFRRRRRRRPLEPSGEVPEFAAGSAPDLSLR
ncbi:MAG: DUF222 domain-containing protein [Acidobacteria bacterium]|nr:DUF222 domain-containing protein [Acidobacteriota bacterium]